MWKARAAMTDERMRKFAVRRGDWWSLTTNNGEISRFVKSVACGVVSYTNGGKLSRCSIETFRRWARAAELQFAEDWSGRETPAVLSAVEGSQK